MLRKGAAAARSLAAVSSAESRCEGQHAAGMVKVLISSCKELDLGLQYLPPFHSLSRSVRFGALTSEFLLHAVSRPRDGEEWKYSTGHITEDMIRERLFPSGADVMCGLCGPPAMVNAACLPNFKVQFCKSSGSPLAQWSNILDSVQQLQALHVLNIPLHAPLAVPLERHDSQGDDAIWCLQLF